MIAACASAKARAAACDHLGFAGLTLDPDRSATVAVERSIGPADETVSAFVIPAREDVDITRQVPVLLVRPA